jgi:hypothetical protein
MVNEIRVIVMAMYGLSAFVETPFAFNIQKLFKKNFFSCLEGMCRSLSQASSGHVTVDASTRDSGMGISRWSRLVMIDALKSSELRAEVPIFSMTALG